MKKLIFLLILLSPSAAVAEILPEALGELVRVSHEPMEPDDKALYDELGFEEAERAAYEKPDGSTTMVEATRFYDDTAAYAAYHWQRPAAGAAAEYGKRAWAGPESTLIHFGNYLVEISGAAPEDDHIELMLAFLPRVRVTPDPPVLKFVPEEGLIESSRRHVLGPESLERAAPSIPPSVAGFHFGAEAQVVRYETPAGEMQMLIFSYPSPQMARKQVEEFYQLEDVVAKRSGSLIGVVAQPSSADEAQRLLARVRYEAEVTANQQPAKRHDNLGILLLDIVILCGILIGLMLLGGLLVGGARILAGRYAPNSIMAAPDGSGMTRLGIDDPRPNDSFPR